MGDVVSLGQMREILPKNLKDAFTQEMVDDLNSAISDPIFAEMYRDNLLSFTSVLNEGKYKMTAYLDAVRYACFKFMGDTNESAYSKTFPDRYRKLVAQGLDAKAISAYVAAYAKGKLVNSIMGQAMIPVSILNMDVYQKAINVQTELMLTAKSEKVRCDAANSLLTQLKPPEVKKLEVEIGTKDDGSIDALRKATQELTEMQRNLITSGSATARTIADSRIIDVNPED